MPSNLRNPCEWNPAYNVPNTGIPMNDGTWTGMQGCRNEAIVIVGANGQWRLCASCAELTRFRRYRIRKALAKESK